MTDKEKIKIQKREAFLRRKAEEEAAEAKAAHAQWVAWVEGLPAGPKRAAEEAWGLRDVQASYAWGGGPHAAAVYRARMAAT